MVTTETKLVAKLVQLKITVDRAANVLNSEHPEAIERHLKALRTIVTEADQHRRGEERRKIIEEEDLTQICKCRTSRKMLDNVD